MKTLLTLSLLWLSSSLFAFYGKDITQYQGEASLYFYTKDLSNLEGQAKTHASFMIGSLIGHYKPGGRGTTGFNFEVSELSSVEAGNEFKVSYKFRGDIALENNVDTRNFSVLLPLRPQKTMTEGDLRCLNQNGFEGVESILYIYWYPYSKRCPSEENVDFAYYSVALTPKSPRAALTYPRYEEMIQDGVMDLYLYFGSDFYSMSRFGEAGKNYATMKTWAKRNKFITASDSFEFQREVFPRPEIQSDWMRVEKIVHGRKIRLTMMLGNPVPNTPQAEEEFFWFMKKAYESGSFVHYLGHEGTGDLIDLARLSEKYKGEVNFPEDRFQIYYFNGCLTYIWGIEYFPRMKKGLENLHYISNGTTTWTDTSWRLSEDFIFSLHDYFVFGTRTSYQSLIDGAAKKLRSAGRSSAAPMLMVEGDN